MHALSKALYVHVYHVHVSAACTPGAGRLLRLLCPVTGGLMWRTAKADVLAEMGVPPQHHHTTVLRLSAIERHWYNRYTHWQAPQHHSYYAHD